MYFKLMLMGLYKTRRILYFNAEKILAVFKGNVVPVLVGLLTCIYTISIYATKKVLINNKLLCKELSLINAPVYALIGQ